MNKRRFDVLGNEVFIGDKILTYRTTGRGSTASLLETEITGFTPCMIKTTNGNKGGDFVLISKRNDNEVDR